jgi:hypothetical protein
LFRDGCPLRGVKRWNDGQVPRLRRARCAALPHHGGLQTDAVLEFTAAHEKGRWCETRSSSGSVLRQGLFIEASLILPMPLPLHLLRPVVKAAVASDPLL